MPLDVSLSFPSSAAASAALADGLKVQGYELHDEMSALFELTVEALSTDPALEEAAFVGEAVVVSFGDEPFVKQIHGIVRQMVQRTSVPAGDSKYAWIIVPPLWLATRRRDHRIFQHLSVPAIAAAVLADPSYGGRIATPSLLTGEHAEREYCVQYGETDWEFLSRILADEGIAGFFDHAQESRWTLVDDTSARAPAGAGKVLFSDPTHPNPLVLGKDTPHVQTAAVLTGVEATGIVIRDYDFEKPQTTLEARHIDGDARPGEGQVETYGYEVGKFSDQAAGEARAEALLEGERALCKVVRATSTFAAPAGTRLTLQDHPRADLDAELLVVRSRASVTFGEASSREMDLIPIGTRFRPKHRPKPRIFGTQTAFVVCAPGQEIDVDAYGRVEIEHNWDRRDQSVAGISRRVRVAQGWAGPGYGFVTLPRSGHEVIVAYLDGDPDEPIIVGRVHNATSRTPLDLPKDKAISVWRSRSTPDSEGFNQILMDDAAGAERLELHAQRDFKSETGHDATTTVGNNASSTVTGNSTNKVGGGYNLTSGSTSISTGAYSLSADTVDVYGKSHVHIATNLRSDDSMFHGIDAVALYALGRALISLTSGGSEIDIEPASIKLSNGGSSITITAGGIDIKSTGTITVAGAVVDVKGAPIKLNS